MAKIIEYGGEGVKSLTVPERATITNMGAELGATTSIFPSDDITREFLRAQGRENDWTELLPDTDAFYGNGREESTVSVSLQTDLKEQLARTDRKVVRYIACQHADSVRK